MEMRIDSVGQVNSAIKAKLHEQGISWDLIKFRCEYPTPRNGLRKKMMEVTLRLPDEVTHEITKELLRQFEEGEQK